MNSSQCPLCGGKNECAAAQTSPGSVADCWCFRETVPPELVALVPEASRGKVCICSGCVRRFQDGRPGR